MPVIPVNRVVDKKRIIEKMEGQREVEAQGVTDPPPQKKAYVLQGTYFKECLKILMQILKNGA
jgi:hypothetical protein